MSTGDDALPPVSAIADVLALWGRDGWLTPPLRPLVAPQQPLIGAVRTVAIAAASQGTGLTDLYALLDGDLAGSVVIIGADVAVHGAVFGEILGTAAQRAGAVAVLVDGAVRDVRELAQLGLPLFASDQRVVGPNGTAHVVGLGGVVTVDRTSICGDDHVVVDASGCIRITGNPTEVLDAARRYAAAEEHVLDALRDGTDLPTAYLIKRATVAELRR